MKKKNKKIDVFIIILVFISSAIYFSIEYISKTYVVSFEMLMTTLFSNTNGTSSEIIIDAIKYIGFRVALMMVTVSVILIIMNLKSVVQMSLSYHNKVWTININKTVKDIICLRSFQLNN